MTLDLGICFHRTEPASSVAPRARQAEQLGFRELWVIEDCFFTTGVTLAAAALTATSEIGAVGTPDDALEYLARLEEAGAHAVALFPSPFEPTDDAANLAAALLDQP